MAITIWQRELPPKPPTRFRIIYRDGAYFVDHPGVQDCEVVDAAAYDALVVRDRATQLRLPPHEYDHGIHRFPSGGRPPCRTCLVLVLLGVDVAPQRGYEQVVAAALAARGAAHGTDARDPDDR